MTSGLRPPRMPGLSRLLRMATNPGRAFRRQARTTQRRLVRTGLRQVGVPRQLGSRVPRLINRFTRGFGRRGEAEETVESVTLEPLSARLPEARDADLGPPSILDRSRLLEPEIRQQAGEVGRVLYRANTVAIVTRGSLLSRIFNRLKKILLLPLALLDILLGFRDHTDRGRLNKPVLAVDRSGHITLFRDGRIRSPYLGIDHRPRQFRTAFSLELSGRKVRTSRGIRVTSVQPGGRADRSGIKERDVLLTLHRKLLNAGQIPQEDLALERPRVALLRSGEVQEFTLQPARADDRGIGVNSVVVNDLAPTTVVVDQIVRTLSGVEIASVHRGGPAARARLRPEDVLLVVDNVVVESQDALRLAMSPRMINSPVWVGFWRRGTRQQVSLPPPQADDTLESYLQTTYRLIELDRPLEGSIGEHWRTLQSGIAIMGPDPAGRAATAGIQAGTTLLALNGMPLDSDEAVAEAVAAAASTGQNVDLTVEFRRDVDWTEITPTEIPEDRETEANLFALPGTAAVSWS